MDEPSQTFESIMEDLIKDDEVEFETDDGTVCWVLKENKVWCEGSIDAFEGNALADLHNPDSLQTLNNIYKSCQTNHCRSSIYFVGDPCSSVSCPPPCSSISCPSCKQTRRGLRIYRGTAARKRTGKGRVSAGKRRAVSDHTTNGTPRLKIVRTP
jgi:hypothetical protein